jgi:dephospho-CoA kinase
MMKTVCAMVGSFGSGCSYIADKILVERHGLRKVSLSDILRDELRRETRIENPSRDELQRYGTQLRQRHSPGYLAERAVDQIRQMADEVGVVVDSVRNPGELAVLRREFTTFYSIGVYATQETRWERVREQYSGNHDDFIRDDKTDKDICFREVHTVLECPECGCVVYTNSFFNIVKCSSPSCNWEAKLSEYREEWRKQFIESIKERAKNSREERDHVTV